MKKEWRAYIFYKAFMPATVILLVAVLNLAGGKLIDLLLIAFQGTVVIVRLVISFVITLLISIGAFIISYRGLKKLRNKIFPLPPEKPKKMENAKGGTNPAACTCAAGVSREMVGMMKISLPGGQTAVITSNIVKREDGAGLSRLDCKVGNQQQTCAYRINFCPMCGGKFVKTKNQLSGNE